MDFDWLVVGAGLTGATFAERIATVLGQRVLVIDSRPHIAGNTYDAHDDAGVLVHRYGPHIFHTGSREVWEYLSRFTAWLPYVHRVKAVVDDRLVPVPFNLDTLAALAGPDAVPLSAALVEEYGDGARVPILRLLENPRPELQAVGQLAFEKVFLHYTTKQWGLTPHELDPGVTARVPVVVGHDDRYFRDPYQGIPADGYTAMVRRMLDHPHIRVATSTSYEELRSRVGRARVIYTGPIDEFFDDAFGALPYRSLRFEQETLTETPFQPVAQVNFPDQRPYTRIIEHAWFTGAPGPVTTITHEFPEAHERGRNEPYYPVPTPASRGQYAHYAQAAAELYPRVLFAGRLADYRYYDMHQAVGRALMLFRTSVIDTTTPELPVVA